jgi:hypothetical protein
MGGKGPGTAGRVALEFVKSLGAGLFLGGILFLAAGRLDWPLAWVYTGIVDPGRGERDPHSRAHGAGGSDPPGGAGGLSGVRPTGAL